MQMPMDGRSAGANYKQARLAFVALLSACLQHSIAVFPLVMQAPAAIAQTKIAESVARVAQSITVRIEGATQGSGVLVKRDGDRYTVLTAWHVVSGQRAGEELDVYTFDGQKHSVEQGSINRIGEVDLAVLTFASSGAYEVAAVGDVKSVTSGSSIYVSGFPLPTSAVPTRVFRFLKGDVIANETVSIPNGYQLLYSNPATTLPGMSGGAVLNVQGELVGIHGQGETDSQMSEQEGVAVKTGTNQGVPISYFLASKRLGRSPEIAGGQFPGRSAASVLCASNAVSCMVVELTTSKGTVELSLDGSAAPLTAGNFVDLVRRGTYNGTLFHRVVKEPIPFVVQGGDPQSSNPNTPVDLLGTGSFVDPSTGQPRLIPLELFLDGDSSPR